MKDNASTQDEAVFHDQWAESTRVEDILVDECFESPTAMENGFILERLGDLTGKRLIDYGSGLGDYAVYFAKKGARVIGYDVSPGALRKCQELAAFHKTSLETGLLDDHPLTSEPDESVDVFYCANTLHHSHEKNAILAEAKRVLKPGGIFVSWDPLAYNPVIWVYRALAGRMRSRGEFPLTRKDVRLLEKYFPGGERRFYWLTTLLLFVKYFAVDWISPSEKRYWKLIYKPANLSWWIPLKRLDEFLTRTPLGWLSWNVLYLWQKPGKE